MKFFFESPKLVIFFLCLACNLLIGCVSQKPKSSIVEIIERNGQFDITVNNESYDVKGAGIAYTDREKMLAFKQAGGNTFRTWNIDNLDQELAVAKELDLMMAVGFATGKELQGFDYNDEKAVAEQFKQVTVAIDKYKNHPNILMWVIANEPNLLFDEEGKPKRVNPKVYDAMADIIGYIHKTDPNHPVTFTLAGAHPKLIQQVVKQAPNIDIISVQAYGDLANVQENIVASGVKKPFMVTEFGPMGHWELPKTDWNREIEEPSAIKAAGMAKRMQENIIDDKTGKIIGSFAFFWGQKQERTPTWYGMFNESGEETARIDELTRIWTGQYPGNRAPLSESISINQRQAAESIRLKPGQNANLTVKVSDPDNDALTYKWVLMDEVVTRSQGGHFEAKPNILPLEIFDTQAERDHVKITFKAPENPGEYRLFSYVYDGNNNVGNANIPFLVE